MCWPLVIPLAIAAASAASGAITGHSQQTEAYKANQTAAYSALANADAQTTMRQAQQQDATGQNKFNADLQAQSEEARAANSAGGAGVAGLSIGNLVSSYGARASRYDAAQDQNLGWQIAQGQEMKMGYAAQAANQINSLPNPSGLDLGLQLATGFFSSTATAMNNNPGLFSYTSRSQSDAFGLASAGKSGPMTE